MKYLITNYDVQLFQQIISLNQRNLKTVLSKFLNRRYKKVIENEFFLCAIGDIPVGLVAHLDTVFSKTPNTIVYEQDSKIIWSPEGLGADDRAGVYAIIKLIKMGLKPTVIFTVDEELGCIGAQKLIEQFKDPFTKINYLIELDRRESNDCVFYDCDNKNFISYIESFGYKEAKGTFSDISVIGEAWKVAAVNLSVGYYNEHSCSETLNFPELFNTIFQVYKMLNEKIIPEFSFVKKESIYTCNKCGKTLNKVDLVPVMDKTESYNLYCIDCLVDKVKWCKKCFTPFDFENEYDLCPKCRKDSLN